jgi:putative transposase
MSDAAARYKNHHFPPEIIARAAVWLYYRVPSLRHVEAMLLERGIMVSYETIRRWGRKHGGISRAQPRGRPRRAVAYTD